MVEDKIGDVCRENEDNYNYVNFKQNLGREKNYRGNLNLDEKICNIKTGFHHLRARLIYITHYCLVLTSRRIEYAFNRQTDL